MIETIQVNFNFYSAQLSKDKKKLEKKLEISLLVKLEISLLVKLELSLLNFVSKKQTKIKDVFNSKKVVRK